MAHVPADAQPPTPHRLHVRPVGGYARTAAGSKGKNLVPHILYRWYDVNGVPLYFGITRNRKAREKAQQRDAWWLHKAICLPMELPNRAAALEMEWWFIREERPVFNREHNPVWEMDPEAWEKARREYLAGGAL